MSRTARQVRTPRSTFTVENDRLVLRGLRISFQRTLRVSENGLNALPPGFGAFPLRVVDHDQRLLSPAMVERGGIMLPLYQREAMWLSFHSDQPVAVQIGAGGRCVVSGTRLKDKLRRKRQNYVVVPDQPWIDGFKTADGEVRQFVAVPAGSGLSAEAQLAGDDSMAGMQIQVWHLTPEALERWREEQRSRRHELDSIVLCTLGSPSMALGLGGRISQKIYPDTFDADDWRPEATAKVWVHLVSAADWRACTGEVPPPTPVTSASYIAAGLPWFDLYDADADDLPTSDELRSLKSVGELSGDHDDTVAVGPDDEVVHHIHRRTTDVPRAVWAWG